MHIPEYGWAVVDSFRVRHDTAKSRKVPVAKAYLERLTPATGSVKALLLTHWHEDHTAGAAELVAFYADSLEFVGLPPAFSARELGSYVAGLLGDDLAAKKVRDLLSVMTELDKLPDLHRLILVESVSVPLGTATCKIDCLSPSESDLRHHASSLACLDPKYTGPRPKVADVNSASVVMAVNCRDVRVLLGSDLDVGDGPNRGWHAVVKHYAHALAADLVKIPHHGSSTSYLEDAWRLHGSEGQPEGVVTPFPAAGKGEALPRPEILEKVAKHCSEVFLTSPAPARGGRKAGKVASKHTPFRTYTKKKALPIEAQGQVRYRWDGLRCVRQVFPPASARR